MNKYINLNVIIILKQIPHAFGYDADYEGDETFTQADGQNTFSELFNVIDHIHLGAVVITIISLIILIMWPKVDALKRIKLVPGALVAVILGVALNEFFISTGSSLAIAKEHLVSFFIRRKRSENSIFIVAWLIAGWFVYELINSKLPAYAIGALPAISLIVADQIEHFRSRLASNVRWYAVTAIIQLVITVAIGLAFIFIAFYFLDGFAQVASLFSGLLTVGLGIYLFKNERKDFLLLCMSALIPSFFAWTFIVGSFEEDRCTTKTVAHVVASNYKLSSQVVFTKDFSLPSLPFYLAVKGFTFIENQDFETYKSHLTDGDVLIFDQDGLNLFREQQNELFDQKLILHQVDGWIPDRGKKITYFIVSRDL